jgi:hypothetical protein
MISWRLIVPALLVAAAVATCLTYFFTPPPTVVTDRRLPLAVPKAARGTSTNIDQHSSGEESAEAFLQAAKAILKRAPDAQASAGTNELPTAEHIPLAEAAPAPAPMTHVSPPVRVFEKRYNLPMLLPPSNSIFVPASEPHISIYALSDLALDFTSPGWGTF